MTEGKISRALNHLDDDLISDAANAKGRKPMGKPMWERVAALAAAFVLLLGGVLIIARFIGGAPDAIVAFDVNPSIEIELNGKNEIIGINALNADAKKLVGELDLDDKDFDTALDLIVAEMIEKGYISIDKNSILVSVDAESTESSDLLKQRVFEHISALLDEKSIEASVITQDFARKSEVKKLAEEYGISVAKATLIKRITDAGISDSKGNAYTYEELAELRVNELKLMLESKGLHVEGIASFGIAGEGDFIGSQAAIEIAYRNAGVISDDVVKLEIELDFDKKSNMMLYEIEFVSNGCEYEYEINAVTGDIAEYELEPDGNAELSIPEGCIDKKSALAIVYTDAELASSEVTEVEFEIEHKDGRTVYEIEFETRRYEYEYLLDAKNQEILKREKKNR